MTLNNAIKVLNTVIFEFETLKKHSELWEKLAHDIQEKLKKAVNEKDQRKEIDLIFEALGKLRELTIEFESTAPEKNYLIRKIDMVRDLILDYVKEKYLQK